MATTGLICQICQRFRYRSSIIPPRFTRILSIHCPLIHALVNPTFSALTNQGLVRSATYKNNITSRLNHFIKKGGGMVFFRFDVYTFSNLVLYLLALVQIWTLPECAIYGEMNSRSSELVWIPIRALYFCYRSPNDVCSPLIKISFVKIRVQSAERFPATATSQWGFSRAREHLG